MAIDFHERLRSLLDEFQRQVVDVRLAAAGTSCAAARLALESLLNIIKQRQMLFPDTDPSVPGQPPDDPGARVHAGGVRAVP